MPTSPEFSELFGHLPTAERVRIRRRVYAIADALAARVLGKYVSIGMAKARCATLIEIANSKGRKLRRFIWILALAKL